MAEIKIIKYTPDYFDKWNTFIESSNNGTIFHRLDFLAYHGRKFLNNEHHLIFLKGEHIFAVMPMAIFEIEGRIIAKSPFGGSYGGIVTREVTNYSTSKKIITLLIDYLNKIAADEIIITDPPSFLSKVPSDTLLFSFLEEGFKITNSDISSIVTLDDQKIDNGMFTTRERNVARKARKANVIAKFNQSIEDFWMVMELTFQKHNAKPTHVYNEWKYLCEKFPNRFWNDVAYIDNKPVAGIGHIKINDLTDSSFYLCNDPEFYETQALSLLIYESLLQAQSIGYKRFDFGTSSVNMVARENIFRFKESFGAIGVFRHTLQLEF